MGSFRQDPYLWVHLAGLAAVPLWLDGCLLGLATGDPWLPTGLELSLVAIAGAAPILWMQWQKPFCIYSLLVLSLRPNCLSNQQRQVLHLFHDWPQRVLTLLLPLPLVLGLWQLYSLAPLAAGSNPLATQSRPVGLLLAAVCFLLVNLFVQVPVSVLRVLAASQARVQQLTPYSPEQVPQQFTLIGLPVSAILPNLRSPVPQPSPPAPARPPQAAPEAPSPQEPASASGDTADSFESDSDWDDSDHGAAVPETAPLEAEPPNSPAASPVSPPADDPVAQTDAASKGAPNAPEDTPENAPADTESQGSPAATRRDGGSDPGSDPVADSPSPPEPDPSGEGSHRAELPPPAAETPAADRALPPDETQSSPESQG